MVFPLLRNGNIAGVLEVFSSRPAAFGERDERTLEALAKRVLKNVERAADSSSIAAPQNSPALRILPIPRTESVNSRTGSETTLKSETTMKEDEGNVGTPETHGRSPKVGRDAIVFTLGGVGASWVSRKQEPVLDLPRWFRRLFLAFAILDVGGFIAVLTMVLTTHFPGRGYLMAGFFYGSAGIAAVLYGVQLRLTRKK